MSGVSGWDLVCLSTTNWEFPWGSRQQLMTRFARDNRVLFVEYQASVLQWPHARSGGRLTQVSPSLWVYRPVGGLPGGYYSPAVNALNQASLERQLASVMRRLGWSRPLLWVYAPCSLSLIGRLGERGAVYHAIDLYKEERDHAARRAVIESMERAHVPRADLVVASTSRIADYLRPIAKRISIHPSAADEAPEAADTAAPSWPRPVAGFIGTIDERVDVELLHRIASDCPSATLVFAGPVVGSAVRRRVGELARRTNVRAIGRIDRERVPAYIKAFDICLLPYRKTPFTDAISPIKVYEYLRAGKPVIATDLEGLRALGDVVELAGDAPGFVRAVARACGGDAPGAPERRAAFARQHTWERRHRDIAAEVAACLAEPAR